MARMIPATIHSTVSSGAERRLFRVIADAPGTDDWICLHSLGLARHATKRRAEIDFVLLTQHGAFVLEVKGGRVRREEGIWYCVDKYGVAYRKPESPFDQAASAMFALEREVRKEFGGSQIADVLFGYGVVVPDVEFEALGCESDPALVYDVRDRKKPFRAYSDRLTRFTRDRQPHRRRGLSRKQIVKLSEFLRRDFDLVPSMEAVISDTRSQLVQLTREQRIVLDTLEDLPRVIVEGPAGSGKTLLAIEAARRAARKGRRVLFLCYNKLLAARVKAVIAGEQYRGSIATRTLHSQFRRMIDNSSLKREFEDRAAEAEDATVFGELYPEYAALAALEDAEPPYDCLVIDEAQDIMSREHIEILEELTISGLQAGSWRVFLDANNQACIYGRLEKSAMEQLRGRAVVHVLTLNCRNTKPIEFHTTVLSKPDMRSVARIDGPPVHYLSYEAERDPLASLEGVLNELRSEVVRPGQLSVLLTRVPSSSETRKLTNLGIRRLEAQHVPLLGSDQLEYSTWSVVSGFKGLENDVIVLVGIEDIDQPWWRAVTYVGMSRARARLYVIISKDCDATRRARLERELQERLGESEMYA